jgi:hypothetical protein
MRTLAQLACCWPHMRACCGTVVLRSISIAVCRLLTVV